MCLTLTYISLVVVAIWDDVPTEAHRHTLIELPIVNAPIRIVCPPSTMRPPILPLPHVYHIHCKEFEWTVILSIVDVAWLSENDWVTK